MEKSNASRTLRRKEIAINENIPSRSFHLFFSVTAGVSRFGLIAGTIVSIGLDLPDPRAESFCSSSVCLIFTKLGKAMTKVFS